MRFVIDRALLRLRVLTAQLLAPSDVGFDRSKIGDGSTEFCTMGKLRIVLVVLFVVGLLLFLTSGWFLIVDGPQHEEYGSFYGARDPEGNLWSFGTYRPEL